MRDSIDFWFWFGEVKFPAFYFYSKSIIKILLDGDYIYKFDLGGGVWSLLLNVSSIVIFSIKLSLKV